MVVKPVNYINSIPEYKALKPLSVISKELNIPEQQIIKLDGNENPFGYPKTNILSIIEDSSFEKYPDPLCGVLLREISKKEGCEPDNVFVSAGADELIDLLIKTFVEKDEVVLTVSPSFGMYEYLSKANGVRFETCKLSLKYNDNDPIAKYVLDEDIFVDRVKSAKLIFLTRPNNPDGQIFDVNLIKKLLKEDCLLVVDEAYIEFSETKSLSNLVQQNENLVVIRTFSKAFALGGLRIGYGIMPKYICNYLKRIKQPYNVNIIAQKLAFQSLNDEIIKNNLNKIIFIKKYFFEEILNLWHKYPYFWVHDTYASFILFTFCSESEAMNMYYHLKHNGILTRYYKSEFMKKNLRISIGRGEQMIKVLEEIKNYFGYLYDKKK